MFNYAFVVVSTLLIFSRDKGPSWGYSNSKLCLRRLLGRFACISVSVCYIYIKSFILTSKGIFPLSFYHFLVRKIILYTYVIFYKRRLQISKVFIWKLHLISWNSLEYLSTFKIVCLVSIILMIKCLQKHISYYCSSKNYIIISKSVCFNKIACLHTVIISYKCR